MKICKKPFAGRVRLYQSVLTVILFVVLAVQSEATIYTLNSAASGVTYSTTFDTGSGLTAWQINGGASQLNLQSLYYSLGFGAVSPLSSPAVVQHTAASLTATYTVSGIISVADSITLNGNTLGEQIKFTNLSGNASTFSLFQYSDFVLGNAPGSQTLNMAINSSSQATANQSGGGVTLQWLGQLTGGAVEVQANNSGTFFGPFNGTATVLNNTPLSVFGNAVFGYEFDAINLAAGNSLTVSETAALVVPEPSSVALVALGMIAAATLYRIRKGSVIAN
jgi:PEP-CTERM motif